MEGFARPLLGDLVSMCENVVQWAVGANQLLRRLLADAAHTWHVVRRVANEREIVGDERRRHTEPLTSILDAHPLLLDARRASAAWIQQPYAGPHELLKILFAEICVVRLDDIEEFQHDCRDAAEMSGSERAA